MPIVSAVGSATGTATATAVARVKNNFSRQHLIAARHFASLAVSTEGKGSVSEQETNEHRAYVIGSVVLSTAFIEASINEFYLEAVDGNQTSLVGLTTQQMAMLAERWKNLERSQVLQKYQIALDICGKGKFTIDPELFQGTYGLVKMRNVLIHYRPEWDDELKEHKEVQTRLADLFPLNSLASAGSLWFPHQCLGAGCAQWAVTQAADFVTAFCICLSIPSRVP
jgi:hypothetical protein